MKTITLNEYYSLSQQEKYNFIGIINHDDGTLEYLKNRKHHREDGPALIYPDGSEYWYFEDKLHRIGGPASIHKTFNMKSYYIHGQPCTKEAHDLWVDLMKLKEINLLCQNQEKINKKIEKEIKNNFWFRIKKLKFWK